jgi:hypothetical protein
MNTLAIVVKPAGFSLHWCWRWSDVENTDWMKIIIEQLDKDDNLIQRSAID